MIYSDAEIDKLWKAYQRAADRAIAAEDAGKPSAALDAAMDRANAAHRAARDGVPNKKHAARLDREIGDAVVQLGRVRVRPSVGVELASLALNLEGGPGALLVGLFGPFKTEASAFKRVLEMAK